ncbi:MAG: VOC family protein [Rhodobacteraceae bacterium]|nr:VOC family protein [Paracoccaceae bacterium]
MAVFDHLAISVARLGLGAAAIEALLGVPLEAGGVHPFMGTHNRLLSLGPGEYLEVIAIDPDAPPPGRPRWFRLDEFAGAPRLTNWIARTEGLDHALAQAPAGAGRAVDLARGDYRWRMGVPDDGRLPFADAFPALIEWQGDRHPAQALPDRGCRLLGLTLTHPDADALRAALPVSDPRITVVTGSVPDLTATLSTPTGVKALP